MSSLPLNISIVTEPPPSNTTLELPVFATVLISLAGVLLLLVVCIPLTVLLIYLRKHRVVKLVSHVSFVCNNKVSHNSIFPTGSINYGPLFPLNDSNSN